MPPVTRSLRPAAPAAGTSSAGLLPPRRRLCNAANAACPRPRPAPPEAKDGVTCRFCDAPPATGLCSSSRPRGPNLRVPAKEIVLTGGKAGLRVDYSGRRPGLDQETEDRPHAPCPSLLTRGRGSALDAGLWPAQSPPILSCPRPGVLPSPGDQACRLLFGKPLLRALPRFYHHDPSLEAPHPLQRESLKQT